MEGELGACVELICGGRTWGMCGVNLWRENSGHVWS